MRCYCTPLVVLVKDTGGVYMRDRAAGLYRLSAYVLAVTTTELLPVVLNSSMFAIIVYWMANLMPAGANFIAHWLVLILTTITVQSFGLLISVIMPSLVLTISFDRCSMVFWLFTCKRSGLIAVIYFHVILGRTER